MKTLTVDEFRATMQNEQPLVVNTLPEDAFREAHIPETKNVPVSDPNFEQRIKALAGDTTRPVVVYCASAEGDASPKAAKKLEEAGFARVYDFEGGLAAWREAGEPVAQGS